MTPLNCSLISISTTFARDVWGRTPPLFFLNLGCVPLILLVEDQPLGHLRYRDLQSTREDLKMNLVSAGAGLGLQPTRCSRSHRGKSEVP